MASLLTKTATRSIANDVVKYAKQLKPSKRKELEIVDLINKVDQYNKT